VRLRNSTALAGDTPVHYPPGTPPEVLATLPATRQAADSMTGENARLALIGLGETPIQEGNANQYRAQFWDFIGLIV